MPSCCKYPPADPGALRCEPLKAADAFVAHAYFPFGSCVHERLCPTFASLSGNSGDFHRLNAFVSQSSIQKQKTVAYSRKCQTSTATPAEPGDLPFGLARTFRLTIFGRMKTERLMPKRMANLARGRAHGSISVIERIWSAVRSIRHAPRCDCRSDLAPELRRFIIQQTTAPPRATFKLSTSAKGCCTDPTKETGPPVSMQNWPCESCRPRMF